jgi:hypothetical protein
LFSYVVYAAEGLDPVVELELIRGSWVWLEAVKIHEF